MLAGKGVASSVGVVPGKLENRDDAISQLADLLEMKVEDIERKLSAKWVKEDSFVPLKTIPKVDELKLLSLEPDKETLAEKKDMKIIRNSGCENFRYWYKGVPAR